MKIKITNKKSFSKINKDKAELKKTEKAQKKITELFVGKEKRKKLEHLRAIRQLVKAYGGFGVKELESAKEYFNENMVQDLYKKEKPCVRILHQIWN